MRHISRSFSRPARSRGSRHATPAPADITGWGLSPRGAGFLFGADITKIFAHNNAIDLIARAHQLAMEGYKLMFDKTIVTVWSAPNYCYRCVTLPLPRRLLRPGADARISSHTERKPVARV